MIRRAAGLLISVVGAILLVTPAARAAEEPAGHCSGVAFGDTVGVARVTKSQRRVNFVRGVHEDKQCPSAAPQCRDKPYLLSGNVVLTTKRFGDFVCADYVNSRGIETIGWLPAAALEAVEQGPLARAAWAGAWRRIEAEIQITLGAGGALLVKGSATYGANDPQRAATGRVNLGELDGRSTPQGDTLFFSDQPAASFEEASDSVCAVRMRRVAQYLIVEDNKACGGMNVSFSGIYVKR
jgi:hypothetical protein